MKKVAISVNRGIDGFPCARPHILRYEAREQIL